MLTHLIQSRDVSIFLIDEPDIYLHSELQRQLLGLLKNLGPDILLATHSTEIITEAETDDIVLVKKSKSSARRIKDPSQLQDVFGVLGSNMNPTLTQLAKTRRVLFLEGKDFLVFSKFARKLNASGVGNRRDFAVVPIEGFNPERARNLKKGMEMTLGTKISAAVILDRDYRCKEECSQIIDMCKDFCGYALIHQRKEVENFLLIPTAMDRAVRAKIADRSRRAGISLMYSDTIEELLTSFSEAKKSYITAQLLSESRRFERFNPSGRHESKVVEATLDVLNETWANLSDRLRIIPGKEALGEINKYIQDHYTVSITATAIIDAMHATEIPEEMTNLIGMLDEFSASSVGR